MRSNNNEASCATASSSVKNSWNSSMSSSVRGIGSAAGACVCNPPHPARRPAEQFAAAFQLGIHPLQHAERELAVALDGDDPGVRQVFRGITLEFDALLEVHQIELDLIRDCTTREVGDDDVKQGGLARTGLAGDQHVLAGALADGEHLEFLRTGAADRHPQFLAGIGVPELPFRRRDLRERNLHAVGIDAGTCRCGARA